MEIENKNSFFSLTLDTSRYVDNPYQFRKLEDSVDLILATMKVKNYWYRFNRQDKLEVVYLFRTEDRKRRGQLAKHCQLALPSEIEYEVHSSSRSVFEQDLNRYKLNGNFQLDHEPVTFSEYSGKDIQLLQDSRNWFPWQRSIYDLIFNKDGSFKEPHPRHIISITDSIGCSGKSQFFKNWFYNHPDDIARLTYATASQLRASVVKIGKKKLYIVDLARAKGKADSDTDLLSVLEDLKNGLVTNAMYGSGATLLMEPPHIIVSSNTVLDFTLLSTDRWKSYEIDVENRLQPRDPSTFTVSKMIKKTKQLEDRKGKVVKEFVDKAAKRTGQVIKK